uniref:Crinkler family protein n=1 Tax=Rhizophagus irregularis (strain DAOM 181602 / DAOM 197198 / MUCL 43194) TaxID=747089 RepID=U9UJ65_RHIID
MEETECHSLNGKDSSEYVINMQKVQKRKNYCSAILIKSKPINTVLPTQMNSKPFNAFIYPTCFFQTTIAKKSGLEKYIKGTSGDIDLHFVVPKLIFSDYKKQHLHTAKGIVLRNKPSWLDRFKQYVIDVDLKLKDIQFQFIFSYDIWYLAYSPRSWLKLTNLEMSDSFSFRKKIISEERYTAQALVNKEVRKQLPDTVSDDALEKKKERALKIFELFSESASI